MSKIIAFFVPWISFVDCNRLKNEAVSGNQWFMSWMEWSKGHCIMSAWPEVCRFVWLSVRFSLCTSVFKLLYCLQLFNYTGYSVHILDGHFLRQSPPVTTQTLTTFMTFIPRDPRRPPLGEGIVFHKHIFAHFFSEHNFLHFFVELELCLHISRPEQSKKKYRRHIQ